MKRSRDTLTGGTGDVNPQMMKVQTLQSAADTRAVTTVQMPIPRLPTRAGRSIVVEILWIQYYWMNAASTAATNTSIVASVESSEVPAGEINTIRDPHTLSAWRYCCNTLTNASSQFYQPMWEDDLTDGSGHGVLSATDTLRFDVQSTATGQANNVIFYMGYRFKEVALTEYIGIVQSQQ